MSDARIEEFARLVDVLVDKSAGHGHFPGERFALTAARAAVLAAYETLTAEKRQQQIALDGAREAMAQVAQERDAAREEMEARKAVDGVLIERLTKTRNEAREERDALRAEVKTLTEALAEAERERDAAMDWLEQYHDGDECGRDEDTGKCPICEVLSPYWDRQDAALARADKGDDDD